MAEVQQPGSPAPQAQPAAPAAPSPSEPAGLDKVYKDFGIEDTAQQFQQPQSPQPAQQVTPAAPKIPDPFSPEFTSYQAQIQQGVSSLHSQLQKTQSQLSQMEARLAARQTEADIKQAVSTLAEKAGIEPEIAEVAFEARARKDPKLLAIWNNRHKNPKALEAALPHLATEFQQRFAVKQDPQLVENQRAVRVSQQQMATTTKPTEQNKWDNMTFEERRRETARLRSMGG